MANLYIIKALCEQHNMTIDELGDKIGLKRGAIYKMINENSTKIETLEKIAQLFEINVGSFFEEPEIQYNSKHSNFTDMTISTKSIENLIEQNSELMRQVTDLIRMQALNAETINNFSQGMKKKAV